MRNRLIGGVAALAVVAILAAVPAVRADGWGTVKGQVLWSGDIPAAEQLKVDKDQPACLAHGPLLAQNYVIDPKSKGVRWVIVWLADPKNPTKALPIAPSLKEVKPKKVELDQPTCQFEPHALALRVGQTLEVKNTAKVPHNIKVDSGPTNVNMNQIVAPGGKLPISGFKPTTSAAISVSCTIHGWMKGYIRVFSHPYFAVTDAEGNFEIKDAPAGTWNLIAWQDAGWVLPGGKNGMPVTITADGTTDVGKIEMKK
jgi:plastocyanin